MSKQITLREIFQPDNENTVEGIVPPPPLAVTPPNSYDAVPYRSYPYPQTRPERLATIASLLERVMNFNLKDWRFLRQN